jgi:hypothetical protein
MHLDCRHGTLPPFTLSKYLVGRDYQPISTSRRSKLGSTQSLIQQCEKEWRKAGYRDERVCPHMFPNTLDGIPHKWYKIEEACGDTFDWNEIKNNFLKDFDFIFEEALLNDATREIKNFLEQPSPQETQKKRKTKVDMGSTYTYNLISMHNSNNITSHRIDMEKISFPGQYFNGRKPI